MYLQITNRCNMKCAHCGMSCTKKGEDMSIETFRNVLTFGDECITLGGGEPTIHPLFWQILGESIAYTENVWMATNGSMTEVALTLAKMAERGILSVALSLDEFHDPIDPKVIQAFKKPRGKSTNYGLEIRDTSNHLIKAGRCKVGEEGCICEDMFIKPNGDIAVCGCSDSPILGNVNKSDNFTLPRWFESGTCYKNMGFYEDKN